MAELTPLTNAYTELPDNIMSPSDLPFDKAVEIYRNDDVDAKFFVMKIKGNNQVIYLLHKDPPFELVEDQIVRNQAKKMVISFSLLLISFFVVLRLSARLTRPISNLAGQLTNRSPNDISEINLPDGVKTNELIQLVNSFNHYQQQIQELLTRERSFNRFASHELRTPLMVMEGATSLLGQSSDPAFIKKQRQRLEHACNDMNSFVDTLLSLTRDEDETQLPTRLMTKDEIERILADYSHLLANKDISCKVCIFSEPLVKIPETAMKILLGNLLKNAFTYTEQGQVKIVATNRQIEVEDTGIGLSTKPVGLEGYGLGLILVRDICRKYGWQLKLSDNEHGGCTAKISYEPPITQPSEN